MGRGTFVETNDDVSTVQSSVGVAVELLVLVMIRTGFDVLPLCHMHQTTTSRLNSFTQTTELLLLQARVYTLYHFLSPGLLFIDKQGKKCLWGGVSGRSLNRHQFLCWTTSISNLLQFFVILCQLSDVWCCFNCCSRPAL